MKPILRAALVAVALAAAAPAFAQGYGQQRPTPAPGYGPDYAPGPLPGHGRAGPAVSWDLNRRIDWLQQRIDRDDRRGDGRGRDHDRDRDRDDHQRPWQGAPAKPPALAWGGGL